MDPLIRCPRCWKHVTEQARFCPRCGSALKAGNAAYIPRQPEPPRPPERSGGGAATFLLFLLLSALGTAGMLVFGLTTRGPVMVRPPVQALPAPSEWPAPQGQTDDSYQYPYRSEQADPATPYPVPPPARVHPVPPRYVYPPPPVPPAQPQIRQHRHEPRDDEWGR
jgi:hypothetical protein